MSAVTARVSIDLRNRIVAVLREDRDVRNIGVLADQLEAAIRDADPVAWLRHGEESFVQNVPFGAMWISEKGDPRAFPVYDHPPQPAPSEAVEALRPFAEKADRYNEIPGLIRFNDNVELWQVAGNRGMEIDITVGDLRRAREACSALSAQTQDVAEDAERVKAAFNLGYVIACCNVTNLHDEPGIAHDALRELGVTKAEVKKMGLCDYDAKALREIERARGPNSAVYAAAPAKPALPANSPDQN